MQSFDYTTLMAVCAELRTDWLPARVEQVYQSDRMTISMALRTMKSRGWLEISWHPQAARIHIGNPPPRKPDTFTFSQQLIHQLGGLALVEIRSIAAWERVIDLQFARRPQEEALYHVYVEIMGKYSNVILTNHQNEIITVAHQVSQNQSSLRPLLTGQQYQTPPTQTLTLPSREESLQSWRDRISLIPGSWKKQLLKTYRGVSPALIQGMLRSANLDLDVTTDTLSDQDWRNLYKLWCEWLGRLEEGNFTPMTTVDGYNVLGWGGVKSAANTQELVNQYYTDILNAQNFLQLRHQLQQKLHSWLEKLHTKAETFQQRLAQSDRAESYRQNADLLMAYLHQWQPGMTEITLADFATGQPVTIQLEPDLTAVQNAQKLYKQHQKLKRARVAVEPLLADVEAEIAYLEQVESAITQLDTYQTPEDLDAIAEIRDELINQKYLEDSGYRQRSNNEVSTNFHRFRTPNGFEVWIGRNNRQNDYLTFRVAGDYDLWFHAQEIPGSHVLLRLEPGAIADEVDLQYTANLAAYYSRARQSEQVPVIYTEPKHVYKPKGAKPGIAIYKQERILWGKPAVCNI
ncbi:Rqc2 family fibronectin-binding protein [Calothrix sp. NIES-3974]|uniref:Rqc2 family fibronectin-binding protein n=1 Tax=Calothrix sp. NIES-3974 TaxID=2005462 RepID=UPI000BBB7D12|nr:NFACT family protein [Calothrix sp. NIES-3974]